MSEVAGQENFDSVAPAYTLLERLAFGRALFHARIKHLTRFLNHIESIAINPSSDPVRVLLLGEGAGHFLSALSRASSLPLHIDVWDSSAKMLALARARLAREPDQKHTTTFIQGDFRAITFTARSYRAVVSHFFFDMFDEAGQLALINRVTPAVLPGGLWLWSDFNLPARALARWRAQIWLSVMYRFFNVTCGLKTQRLVDPAPRFAALGWTPIHQTQMNAGFIRADLWRRAEATREIHRGT